MAKLVIRSGPEPGREIALSEGLNRVGRAEANRVRLDDPGVSAIHCELWVMQERLLLRDLSSTNGTLVDGRPVTESEIQDGAVLSIGGVELVVQEAPCRVAIPARPPPPPPRPRATADGIPLCHHHSEVHATHRCAKCGEQFCGECVRVLGRRGGRQHTYCPLCDGECFPLATRRSSAPGASRIGKGLLGKLAQTLRLRR